MELLGNEQLKRLIEPTPAPCVSIFLPTHRSGVETKQGPIRLKNLMKAAEQQLAGHSLRTPEIKSLLEPVRKLCENNGFWQYQSDGLAVYRSPERFFYYRLPLPVEELVVVTDRFHVKPLLKLFSEDGRYYLLTLSKNAVRFYQCTRYGMREIAFPEGTPTSLEQVQETSGIEKHLQVHSVSGGAKFHGHGSRADDNKQELREFFRSIDKGVRELLRDEHAPLVLTGVDYLFPLYAESNTYPHLMEGGVAGNPEGRKPQEIQEAAWAIVEPALRKAKEAAARRYDEFRGGPRADNDIRTVLPAAIQGRVDQLFVAVGKQQWGHFDENELRVTLHEEKQLGDRDLLNLAAIQTLLQGGAVYAVAPDEVPGGELLAAVLRY